MSISGSVETVIVGGGQAGLAMSWFLGQAGREHIVLERRASLGGGWQDRWDAFRLVTPNWCASLPGDPFQGPDRDEFMGREAIIARVAGYAATIDAPVELDTDVLRLSPADHGGFRLETNQGDIRAGQIVVATGGYHEARIPDVSSELPGRITQLHSHAYRNESSLPSGAVLVVGSGQSGVQIAEELAEAGRTVFLSVGGAGRLPRRYRGRDIFAWLAQVATHGADVRVAVPTVDKLPDPRARLAGVPHLSGHHGGHETNLRRLAADGLIILGRLRDVDGELLGLEPDLSINLARADAFFDERIRPLIDEFIARAAIEAEPDDRRPFSFEPPEPDEVDLAATGIATIVWATGYRFDQSWIDLPIFDELGMPRHRRGVSEAPGVYFLGLPWQHTMASATLAGPGMDGPYLAEALGLPARDSTYDPAPR